MRTDTFSQYIVEGRYFLSRAGETFDDALEYARKVSREQSKDVSIRAIHGHLIQKPPSDFRLPENVPFPCYESVPEEDRIAMVVKSHEDGRKQ